MNNTKIKFRWLRVFARSLLVLWVVSVAHIRFGPKSVEPEGAESGSSHDVPQSLPEAIAQLDSELDEQTKEKFVFHADAKGRELSQVEIFKSAGYGHLGIGASIRNQWGLWTDSRLKRWFLWRAVIHPDDMSGVILDEFTEHLRNERHMPGNLLIRRLAMLAVLATFLTLFVSLVFAVWRMLQKNNSSIAGV